MANANAQQAMDRLTIGNTMNLSRARACAMDHNIGNIHILAESVSVCNRVAVTIFDGRAGGRL